MSVDLSFQVTIEKIIAVSEIGQDRTRSNKIGGDWTRSSEIQWDLARSNKIGRDQARWGEIEGDPGKIGQDQASVQINQCHCVKKSNVLETSCSVTLLISLCVQCLHPVETTQPNSQGFDSRKVCSISTYRSDVSVTEWPPSLDKKGPHKPE